MKDNFWDEIQAESDDLQAGGTKYKGKIEGDYLNVGTKLLETGMICSQSERVSSNPCAFPSVETMASRLTKNDR